MEGERNYTKLRGDTGPLVRPGSIILNPEPLTLNPTPYLLNPEPSTLPVRFAAP